MAIVSPAAAENVSRSSSRLVSLIKSSLPGCYKLVFCAMGWANQTRRMLSKDGQSRKSCD